ncbi:MAG TPA: hypothetical protein EYQ31_16970 [Candidatus Handelsmanbacteria bacterium]|nr:hypothetical protein [Candidatus Handelsmanbacteria bacterium]
MNTGQMLLVLAALVLFSTIALSINRVLRDNDQVSLEAQSGILAVSLCEGQVEATIAAGFDSLVVGLTTTTLATPFAAFACTTRVAYVDAAVPDSTVTGPTSLKQIAVTVSSDYMTGAVTLSALVGDY